MIGAAEALTQTVQLPLWLLLVFAGYQRAAKMFSRYAGGKAQSQTNTASGGSDAAQTSSKDAN